MDEPTGCAGSCARAETYCDRCDLLVGLPGLRVVDVAAEDGGGGGLRVTVESPPAAQGCRVGSLTPANFITSSTSSKAAWSKAIVHRVFL